MVIRRLRQILEPVRTEEEHEAELLEDEDTTWLGFGRDANGRSVLHDYGRFAAIMGETTAEDTTERFPQLVSFIGETGMIDGIHSLALSYSGEAGWDCAHIN